MNFLIGYTIGVIATFAALKSFRWYAVAMLHTALQAYEEADAFNDFMHRDDSEDAGYTTGWHWHGPKDPVLDELKKEN